MRVLGIDPGYAIVGALVVEATGLRRLFRRDHAPACPLQGQRGLNGVCEPIHRHGPRCWLRKPDQHNQTTAVAEARGVILLAAAQAGLPVYEYTPMQVKQAVTGYGKAVKKQVQE